MSIKKEVVLSKIREEHHNQYLSSQSMHCTIYPTELTSFSQIESKHIVGNADPGTYGIIRLVIMTSTK